LNKILNKYSNSVVLDGNTEPELEPEPGEMDVMEN
jgi:hypothetical protein